MFGLFENSNKSSVGIVTQHLLNLFAQKCQINSGLSGPMFNPAETLIYAEFSVKGFRKVFKC